MSDEENKQNKGTVVSFTDRTKLIKNDKQDLEEEGSLSTEEVLALGFESFLDSLEDAVGFITITFDTGSEPNVIYAGDLDLIKAIGTLEFTKQELMQYVYAAETKNALEKFFNEDD